MSGYKTLSKFGRINLERPIGGNKVENVDELLQEIKHLNDSPIKKTSVAATIAFSNRLVQSRQGGAKIRSRYLPRKKPEKHLPQVRQYVKPEVADEGVPGSAQYTPNYNVYLRQTPQIAIGSSEPVQVRRQFKDEKRFDATKMTQSELMRAWQKDLRTAAFDIDSRVPNEMSESSELIHTPKFSSRAPGVISNACNRISFLPPQDTPAPGAYSVSRPLDKSRVISFNGQATRKEIETIPDRTHMQIARGLDYIKPNPPRPILFAKQTSREKEQNQDKSVWDEIEAEQKALLDVLHPKEEKKETVKQKKQPFSQQTTHFHIHPFESFMQLDASTNLQYDVDKSLQSLDKKLQPMPNFGRRLNDTDRTIYNKTEAPDILYPNVNEEWNNVHPTTGVAPNFGFMHERKSAYDYMPQTCGGAYTYVEIPWSYRTPCVMDKMGERKIIIEVPPEYKQKRASSMQANKFTSSIS